MKQFIILGVIAVVLIGVGTYVQGIYSERWTPMDSEQLDQFAECVPLVPTKIGDWEGADDSLTEKEFAATNCKAYVSRNYRNSATGEEVSFYLVAGTARHITIHTPDWCYQSAGFVMDGDIETYTLPIDGKSTEFATAVFRKPSREDPSGQQALRIFWTYSDDGNWQGPASANYAKVVFARKPALYKVYLIGPATAANESPANPFAREAFPILNRVLFTGGPEKNATENASPAGPSALDLEVDA